MRAEIRAGTATLEDGSKRAVVSFVMPEPTEKHGSGFVTIADGRGVGLYFNLTLGSAKNMRKALDHAIGKAEELEKQIADGTIPPAEKSPGNLINEQARKGGLIITG